MLVATFAAQIIVVQNPLFHDSHVLELNQTFWNLTFCLAKYWIATIMTSVQFGDLVGSIALMGS